jgi:hypothetical protein
MTIGAFIKEPLQGKTTLSRVIWLYGVVGSLLYGALELFIDPGNVWLMRGYIVGGLLLSIYVTVATYRCADNCGSPLLAKIVRVSAIVTLFLLPVLTYLDLSGALTLVLPSLDGEQ